MQMSFAVSTKKRLLACFGPVPANYELGLSRYWKKANEAQLKPKGAYYSVVAFPAGLGEAPVRNEVFRPGPNLMV